LVAAIASALEVVLIITGSLITRVIVA